MKKTTFHQPLARHWERAPWWIEVIPHQVKLLVWLVLLLMQIIICGWPFPLDGEGCYRGSIWCRCTAIHSMILQPDLLFILLKVGPHYHLWVKKNVNFYNQASYSASMAKVHNQQIWISVEFWKIRRSWEVPFWIFRLLSFPRGISDMLISNSIIAVLWKVKLVC